MWKDHDLSWKECDLEKIGKDKYGQELVCQWNQDL